MAVHDLRRQELGHALHFFSQRRLNQTAPTSLYSQVTHPDALTGPLTKPGFTGSGRSSRYRLF
jgi:hypothetical protein